MHETQVRLAWWSGIIPHAIQNLDDLFFDLRVLLVWHCCLLRDGDAEHEDGIKIPT